MTGFDELGKLALDLTAAPLASIPNIVEAIGVTAGKGKTAWQEAAKGHRYVGKYPSSVDYDTDISILGKTIKTELGPHIGKRGAGLGILEDRPGDVHGTPQRNYVKAEEVMAPDLEKGVAIAIDQALKAVNL